VKERSIGLQRQQVIAATPDDLFRDVGLGSDGIDGDERPRQFQPLEQKRKAEDEALTGRPGGDQMQRLPTLYCS
jgi:hypothetical protein